MVELERRGVPAVAIITRPFTSSAQQKASSLGRADLRVAVIDHPLAALEADQIRARAAQAVPQIVSILMGAGREGV